MANSEFKMEELPLGDPRIRELGPWFREIHEAGADAGAIRRVLERRWRNVRGAGFLALKEKILSSTPYAVALVPDGPVLCLEKRQFRSGSERQRRWGVHGPKETEAIRGQLNARGLGDWDELEQFYTHFHGLYDLVDWGDGFLNVDLLSTANEFRFQFEPVLELPGYKAVEYQKSPEKRMPYGIADLSEWYVLYSPGWDRLVADRSHRLAWILGMDWFYLLDISLDKLIGQYARNESADGEEFMDDLVKGMVEKGE